MKISSRPSTSRGFTLIELLVVISIIAVLAGILLPVANSVLERAKRVDAKVTENSIITAVKSYQTEYGQYPVVPASPPTDTTYDITGSEGMAQAGRNGLLFNVLRALNNPTSGSTGGSGSSTPAYLGLNSRRIVYFESKDVKNPSEPRGGFIPSASGTVKIKAGYNTGDLVDPWGGLFCVRMDSNYSDAVVNPYPMTASSSTNPSVGSAPNYTTASDDSNTQTDLLLRTSCVAWSPGSDGKFGDSSGKLVSTCDDVVSWQ